MILTELFLSWLAQEIQTHPYHLTIEVLLAVVALYFILSRPYTPPLPDEEVDEDYIIRNEWHPESLITTSRPAKKAAVVVRMTPTRVTYRSEGGGEVECVSCATGNFLGLANSDATKAEAKKAHLEWGVGTCGPRGFYGTIKPHLDLEEYIAGVYGTEKGIIYSYGYATISSIVPCFSTRGDRIIADEAVSQPTQSGIFLSRSETHYFRHNDPDHLREILTKLRESDKRRKKLTRRWLVLEGVYRDFGDLCNLVPLVELAKEFKYRIILDDSYGMGVLGASGKGILEHTGVDIKDITLYSASFAMTIGSVGGFCVGALHAVEHQRLSSAGYCFSASLPTLLSICAHKNIETILSEDGQVLRGKLQKNLETARGLFQKSEKQGKLKLLHQVGAPIMHLLPSAEQPDESIPLFEHALDQVVDQCRAEGVSVIRNVFCGTERLLRPASIRFALTAQHTDADVKRSVDVLSGAIASVTVEKLP